MKVVHVTTGENKKVHIYREGKKRTIVLDGCRIADNYVVSVNLSPDDIPVSNTPFSVICVGSTSQFFANVLTSGKIGLFAHTGYAVANAGNVVGSVTYYAA